MIAVLEKFGMSRVVKNGGIIRESMPAVKLSGSIMQNIAD